MTHTALKDSSISVILPYYSNEEGHNPHSIELDCPPGGTRPWDLIDYVLEGTGLTTTENSDANHPYTFFGHATWLFPDTTCEHWVEVQKIVKPKIEKLYHSGTIRYGTW